MEAPRNKQPNVLTPLAVAGAKFVSGVSRLLQQGYGATWPGQIARSLQPDIIGRLIGANPRLKIVLVSGTNGKTTTTKLLTHVLRKQGLRVFSNTTGANLLNGIAATLCRVSGLTGRIDQDVAILEVDENVLPLLTNQFRPNAVVLLNIFRDQLDRYGEVDVIRHKWQAMLEQLDPTVAVIANAQDPNLFFIANNHPNILFFGLEKSALPLEAPAPEADTTYCPICFQKLTFNNVAYSHVGIFSCPKHGGNAELFVDLSKNIALPLEGLFNRYNIAAAALVAKSVFGIEPQRFGNDIADFTAAFGRQEVITYHERKFQLQLSKNPTGFNQSIALLRDRPNSSILVILNNEIPDGLDVSWIWDVDYEQLTNKGNKIWIAGARAYDMAIRLSYAFDKTDVTVCPDITEAINSVVAHTKAGDTIYVLPVYSAMLQLRQHLIGGKI